jgi:nicotinamide mononucleotide transporter
MDYPMSHLEFWGTLSGFVAVWLSAKENVWSWLLGLICVTLSFFLFYQVQLYPDMFLQVFFFITNLMGWWEWTHPTEAEANLKKELKVSRLSTKIAMLMVSGGIVCTFLLGTFSQNLNIWFPILFSKPSAFPYMDSFTTVMSIVATYLLVKKKVECWYLWLVIDLIATYMYYLKGIKFYSVQYAVYCIIAVWGIIAWTRAFYKSDK